MFPFTRKHLIFKIYLLQVVWSMINQDIITIIIMTPTSDISKLNIEQSIQ